MGWRCMIAEASRQKEYKIGFFKPNYPTRTQQSWKFNNTISFGNDQHTKKTIRKNKETGRNQIKKAIYTLTLQKLMKIEKKLQWKLIKSKREVCKKKNKTEKTARLLIIYELKWNEMKWFSIIR